MNNEQNLTPICILCKKPAWEFVHSGALKIYVHDKCREKAENSAKQTIVTIMWASAQVVERTQENKN